MAQRNIGQTGLSERGSNTEERSDKGLQGTNPPPGLRIEELFVQQKPPVFHGIENPIDIEAWVHTLEYIFNSLRCSDQERIACVPFQLAGPAAFWWEERKRIMTPVQLGHLTWEQFKIEIYDKYIPTNYHTTQERDFYNLRQDSISLTKYDRAAYDLHKNSLDQVNTGEEIIEKLSVSLRNVAEEFCADLRHGIEMAVACHTGLTYPKSLNRTLEIGAAIPKERSVLIATPMPPQTQALISKNKRKWCDIRAPPEQKWPWQERTCSQYFGRQATPSQTRGHQQRPGPCSKCNRMHNGVCKAGSDGCYICGKDGHFARNCSRKKSNNNTIKSNGKCTTTEFCGRLKLMH